jgi:hypothetical protein
MVIGKENILLCAPACYLAKFKPIIPIIIKDIEIILITVKDS